MYYNYYIYLSPIMIIYLLFTSYTYMYGMFLSVFSARFQDSQILFENKINN